MGSVGNGIPQSTSYNEADKAYLRRLESGVPIPSAEEIAENVRKDIEVAQRTEAAKAALKQISGAKRFNEVRFERPDDGHKLLVTVEKVTTRDYWGRSVGRQTYTVYVWDETDKNEYGNSNRLWYNYGVEGMKDVKDQIRRVAHI